MNNLPSPSPSFDLALHSVCGCAFRVATDAVSARVQLMSPEAEFVRRADSTPAETRALAGWFAQVCGAVDTLAVDPLAHTSEALSLALTASALAGRTDCVRIEASLLSGSGESLDFCHVTVTVDVSVGDLLRAVHGTLDSAL